MNRDSQPRLVEPLFVALEMERHLRAPLLRAVLDELTTQGGLDSAAEEIRTLLAAEEAHVLDESGYRRGIARARTFVSPIDECATLQVA